MKKLRTAALLAVAALALAGCTSAPQAAPQAPRAAPVNAAAVADVKAADPGQEWADRAMNQFIGAHGLSRLDQFDGTESEISDWAAGKPGEIVLTIPDSAYTPPKGYVVVTELDFVGDTFMIAVGGEFKDLKKVTVRTESGKASSSTLRADYRYLDR